MSVRVCRILLALAVLAIGVGLARVAWATVMAWAP